MGVFVEKVYCVSFVQNHENKLLGISNNIILVPFLDMTFFRCGLYKIINFTKKMINKFYTVMPANSKIKQFTTLSIKYPKIIFFIFYIY
jgi:hypothetical protein